VKSETSNQYSAFSPDIATTTPEIAALRAHFRQQLSSTPRGARLARLLAEQQLADWGWPRDSERGQAAALIVAELSANAVTHGRLPGRDFLLTLALAQESPGDPPGTAAPPTLRIEVSDARGERRPVAVSSSAPEAEHGHGLRIVEALATRWGVSARLPSGKTVWAEITG
jgi:two-component sensor histidine kinase